MKLNGLTIWQVIDHGNNGADREEGPIEDKRTPDFRRCERIRWPRPIIENDSDPAIKVWRNRRGSEERVCLWFAQENYLVILADRGDYILPWTAYPVEQPHRQRKLEKEYAAYCRKQAQKG